MIFSKFYIKFNYFYQVTVSDIMISPVNNRKVFVYSPSGESFYTENCGNTYKVFKHDPKLSYI